MFNLRAHQETRNILFHLLVCVSTVASLTLPKQIQPLQCQCWAFTCATFIGVYAGLQAFNQAGLGNDNCQTQLVQLNPRTVSDIFDSIFQVPLLSWTPFMAPPMGSAT